MARCDTYYDSETYVINIVASTQDVDAGIWWPGTFEATTLTLFESTVATEAKVGGHFELWPDAWFAECWTWTYPSQLPQQHQSGFWYWE